MHYFYVGEFNFIDTSVALYENIFNFPHCW